MLSDAVDGWIARRWNCGSVLGLYLDPVVDKVVILSLLYEQAWAGRLPTAVAHLFLVREFLQDGVRAAAAVRGEVVGANWMGKLKIWLQSAVIAWGLLLPGAERFLPERTAATLAGGLPSFAWAALALSWGFLARFLYLNRRTLAGSSPGPGGAGGP
jgi:CDP-diacylglycerol--glycerol-3-phosphate 3-phosphatidyltransferase